MTRLIHYTIYAFLMLLVWAVFMPSAKAATVWTASEIKYYKYDVTPNNLTDSAYKYIANTDIVAVNPAWLKVKGTWIKYTSAGGGVKYAEEGIVSQPPSPGCEAQFVCHEDFGWIVNLSQLKADGCSHVKISKEQALFYDGLRNVDGTFKCVAWPSL